MPRYLALFLLSISLSAALSAQDRAPALLFEAAQCLATDSHQWIDVHEVKALSLGYKIDKKTFAGGHYLYVIVYSTPKRDQGRVFDIRYKEENRQHVYSIENNADFVKTPKGINFTEPPLGGTWTQNQLTTAIQQILHQRKWYEAQVKHLLKPADHLVCETKVEDVVHPNPQPPAPQ
jgi:hypothetical protein